MFSKLNREERLAKLAKVLSVKTEGKLTVTEIQKICRAIDIEKQYEIIVTSDPFQFAEKAREINDEFSHSWAGETKEVIRINPILGNINVGHYKAYTYSQNGNIVEETEEKRDPDFDINEKIVIMRDGYYTSNLNDNFVNEEINEIIVYIPNGYEHDPIIKEILGKILNM